MKPSKWNPIVETDFAKNVQRVSPFLGTVLIVALGLYFMHMLYTSINDFAASVQSGDAINVVGTLKVVSPDTPRYGSLLTFTSSVSGDLVKDGQSYITAICFQDDQLVYQFSAKPHIKFLLTDPLEPGFDWDGGEASCNASLIYRIPGEKRAELYMLDAISFPVLGR